MEEEVKVEVIKEKEKKKIDVPTYLFRLFIFAAFAPIYMPLIRVWVEKFVMFFVNSN